jgi:hypothetical protein
LRTIGSLDDPLARVDRLVTTADQIDIVRLYFEIMHFE